MISKKNIKRWRFLELFGTIGVTCYLSKFNILIQDYFTYVCVQTDRIHMVLRIHLVREDD